MSLLIESDQSARGVLVAVVAAAALAEVVTTYLGQVHDGRRRIGPTLAEAVLLTRRPDGVQTTDRGTKQILVGAALVGLLGAWGIANVRALQADANTWWTLAIGASVALAGACLRSSSVWTLGRHFRREVTIEPNQRVITTGPYRWVRHPAYAGNLLTYGGLGLALGSWVSAAAALTAAFVGLLPRIKLEERTLERAFGPAYVDYERATPRLIPHVLVANPPPRSTTSRARGAAASPTGYR
ncbi:MAG: methyltransferase family protein [Solirubrobacteraceae bacterium]